MGSSKSQLSASDLAREYGFTPRHWTRLAAAGRVPGARQPSGRLGQWLFEAAIFRQWWNSRKREVAIWPAYSVEGERIGLVPSVKTENFGDATGELAHLTGV